MRPVSEFAKGPSSEIEQLEADLRGRQRGLKPLSSVQKLGAKIWSHIVRSFLATS